MKRPKMEQRSTLSVLKTVKAMKHFSLKTAPSLE